MRLEYARTLHSYGVALLEYEIQSKRTVNKGKVTCVKLGRYLKNVMLSWICMRVESDITRYSVADRHGIDK